jgi:hypothetical protein
VTAPCTAIIHKALKAVRPQFRLELRHGIHGVPHWSRVWFHGRALAASLDLDPAVLAWFAFLHDSRRFNDWEDPGHGLRAADFAVHLRRERIRERAKRPSRLRVAPRLDEVVNPRAQRLDGPRLQAPRGLERRVGLAPSQRPRIGPATPDRALGAPRIVRRALLDPRDAREQLVELRALDERSEGHEHFERLRVFWRQVQGQPHAFGRLQPAAQA